LLPIIFVVTPFATGFSRSIIVQPADFRNASLLSPFDDGWLAGVRVVVASGDNMTSTQQF
jgi:hypothetical protein